MAAVRVEAASRSMLDGWASDRAWSWEGNVQAMLANHLATAGWVVTSAADTESKAPGIELVATCAGRWLAIEVKGFPVDELRAR